MDIESKLVADRLASKLTEVISEYTQFQEQIAAAINPGQHQWADLAATLRPLQDQLTSTGSGIHSFQDHWRHALEPLFACIAEMHRRWRETQNELQSAFHDLAPRLREAVTKADQTGRRGWTMTLEMAVPDVLALTAFQTQEEADQYMLHWYNLHDADLAEFEARILLVPEFEAFRTAISQCLSAYRRGDVAIVIPCVTAVLERGIRALGSEEHFYSTRIEKTVRDVCTRAQDGDPESIHGMVMMSLLGFIEWFYSQYGPLNSRESRLFRHGIQHGTQPPPNEKIEALRLFNALDTVAGLYPT